MPAPSRKTVFIVDSMAFRRALVESFLSPWAASETVKLISLDPNKAHAKLVECNDCDMLIYSVGSPFEMFAEIRVLHARRHAALAFISDDQNPATIIAVMRSGAQGYFSNSMPPDLALQALSFVLALFDEKAIGVQLSNRSNGVRRVLGFTERQYAVLTGLCLGDSNKGIGRNLGMTETTVKVHVREIMRKLGVCNRTQVAIAAARNGVGPDGMVEIISLDSTATANSSASHKVS